MVMRTMSSVAKVILDRQQELAAHQAALDRVRYFNSQMDDPSQHGQRFTNLHEFIWQKAEGAGAEIAVANYFGDYGFVPKPPNKSDEADVGNNIEVKWTKHAHGNLIVQNKQYERDDMVAILVTGLSPVYLVMGWMPLHMIMQPKYRHPNQGNYWVPKSNLFEMQYLKRSNYGDN